jgi:putative membrane protein
VSAGSFASFWFRVSSFSSAQALRAGLAGVVPALADSSTVIAIIQSISFRYRFDEGELVITTGLFFRNERHVPCARIQNINAVQNLFHRLLGVVEVRVETGGGTSPKRG